MPESLDAWFLIYCTTCRGERYATKEYRYRNNQHMPSGVMHLCGLNRCQECNTLYDAPMTRDIPGGLRRPKVRRLAS